MGFVCGVGRGLGWLVGGGERRWDLELGEGYVGGGVAAGRCRMG